MDISSIKRERIVLLAEYTSMTYRQITANAGVGLASVSMVIKQKWTSEEMEMWSQEENDSYGRSITGPLVSVTGIIKSYQYIDMLSTHMITEIQRCIHPIRVLLNKISHRAKLPNK